MSTDGARREARLEDLEPASDGGAGLRCGADRLDHLARRFDVESGRQLDHRRRAGALLPHPDHEEAGPRGRLWLLAQPALASTRAASGRLGGQISWTSACIWGEGSSLSSRRMTRA